MTLKGEKNSMMVLLVEGSYYTMKEGFLQIRGGGGRDRNFWRVHNITDMKIQEILIRS